MALHPTRKISNFKNSLKKWIIDHKTFEVFFDISTDIPKDATDVELLRWVNVILGDQPGTGDLIEQFVRVYLYTHKDYERDALGLLHDEVMDVFTDVDGSLISFPLYDTVALPWIQIGGVAVYESFTSDESEIFSGVKYKFINLMCRWNAV